MVEVTEQVLQDILNRLIGALNPQEIYFFGSHASGTPHPHSDVDLLVVVPDDAGDRHELAGQGWIALRGIGVPVDIVVFHRREMNKWSPVRFSLPHTATETGKLLYAA